MDVSITFRYSRARAEVTPGAPVTVLHIRATESWVASGTTTEPATLMLRIGAGQVAETFFRHDPPTPYELESAINRIEDEVVRAHPLLATNSTLITHDAELQALARRTGVAQGQERTVSLEAVERLYREMARSSEASVWRPGEAMDSEQAATLLILREFMHHLGFAALNVSA